MSFDLFRDDPAPPPNIPTAANAIAVARRRRARQRAVLGVTASAAVLIAVVLALPSDRTPTVVNTDQPVSSSTTGDDETPGALATTSTPAASASATTHQARTTHSTTTSTSTTQPSPSHTGTANITFSGVLSGPLAGAVATCNERTDGRLSDIVVNGTLDGQPWVLMVQSYNGEKGVWQVLSGEAGGGTGLQGQGYRVTATYPDTVQGVSQVDWSHGATLTDVGLMSGEGQTPAGNLVVNGTISCD